MPKMRLSAADSIFTISFILFLLLSIHFDEARVIFLDNALHLFLCINNNELGVMAGRWPIAIVRSGLLAGIKLKLSLGSLITIYSLSHIILKWGLLAFIFRLGGLKYLTISFLVLLIPLCHSYFWCVSELIPALLLITPILLIYEPDKTSPEWYLTLLLIPLAYFSHPQVLLALLFIILYKARKNNRVITISIFSTLVATVLIKSLFFPNWYDAMKMEGLISNLVTYKFNPFDSDSFYQLLNWMKGSLFWIPLIYITSVLILIYNRRWVKLILYNGFFFGTCYLFILSNPEKVNIFYAESSTYLLSFYSAIVLIEGIKSRITMAQLCVALVLFSLLRIWTISSTYQSRLNYVDSIVKKQKLPKTIVHHELYDKKILGLDWGLPYETMLLSETRSDKTITTVTEDHRRNYKQYEDQKGVLFNGFGDVFKIKHASTYFNLDFDQKYVWIKTKKGDRESDKEINH